MDDPVTAPGTNVKIDPRHCARVFALQQLFNGLAQDREQIPTDKFTTEDLLAIYGQQEYDQDLFDQIVNGVTENLIKLDEVIQKLAPLWPVEQISALDLIILRIGIWEAFISKNEQVPEKVAIDEAIELAKEFSGETSAKFVNGVLGNLVNNEELKASLLLQD